MRQLMIMAVCVAGLGCGDTSAPGDDACALCSLPNAQEACFEGECSLVSCREGFFDLNEVIEDGCEYACTPQAPGSELCDSEDNDCDGRIDEGYRFETDLMHCGSCGNVCEAAHGVPVCVAGVCQVQNCDEGFLDCDSEQNGCETDRLDTQNCLSCGHACDYANAEGVCDDEGCSMGDCVAGYHDLNDDRDDGCEYACTPSEESTEICDEIDNDCDGQIDEDFDLRMDLDHCGACNNICDPVNAVGACIDSACHMVACLDGFGNCDEATFGCETNVQTLENCGGCGQVCDLAQASESCSAGRCDLEQCEQGWYNINGDDSDGCEYECTTFAQGPDVPDADFRDTNCDGIDGDVSQAAFVASYGMDNPFCDPTSPCASISHAIQVAHAAGKREVYLQGGNYVGMVTLVNGVSIYGGYDGAWQRTQGEEGRVRITGSMHQPSQQMIGLWAHRVTAQVADVIISSPSAVAQPGGRGASSQAVHALGANLVFRRVIFEGGDAASGRAGANGAGSGQQGAAPNGGRGGHAAQFFSCNSSSRGSSGGGASGGCGGTTRGGNGGRGGRMDTRCSGWPWQINLNATGGDSGAGASDRRGGAGAGGGGGGTCRNGGNAAGGSAIHGSRGGGAGNNGRFHGDFWFGHDGDSGSLGLHGTGGGGGGGSGGCDSGTDSHGAGGGGGGAGGCRAQRAGDGGMGAGGSFGVVALDSNLQIYDSIFARGRGGAGGSGGQGGTGQAGGSGGSGGNAAGGARGGGRGGSGGHGGHSGAGGGGGGGHAAAMIRVGGQLIEVGNQFGGGTRGQGGAGGAGVIQGAGGSPGRHDGFVVCQNRGGC